MAHATADEELDHLNYENHQLGLRLADSHAENRLLCVEIGRLRRENHRLDDLLTRELSVRFGRPQ